MTRVMKYSDIWKDVLGAEIKVLVKERGYKYNFFHAKALSIKRKNKVTDIEDNLENWLKDMKNVESRFSEYFQDLFTTSKPNRIR